MFVYSLVSNIHWFFTRRATGAVIFCLVGVRDDVMAKKGSEDRTRSEMVIRYDVEWLADS